MPGGYCPAAELMGSTTSVRRVVRYVLAVVLLAFMGAHDAAAQRLLCSTIRPRETAGLAARRITGDAGNTGQAWFQILDPRTRRFVAKSGYGHIRAGWQACIVNESAVAGPGPTTVTTPRRARGLDSNLVLGDLSRLYSHWLRGQPFVAWRHPQRCSVFDELYVLLASARTDPSRIIDQFVFFSEQGVPDYVPMIEANFLWRDHRDTQVRMLMERLWDHLTGFQSWRDQPGLAYLMWKIAILPTVLPDRLGTSRDNDYARKFAHKKPAAKPAPVTARRASKRLIWIYRNKFSAVASTVLRGHQLADLAKQRLAGKVEIGIVNETCLASSGTRYSS